MHNIKLSFEVFPPQDKVDDESFLRKVDIFRTYNPLFISMTYGAGASKRDRSERLVKKLLARESRDLAAHLACAGHLRAEIREIAAHWWKLGLRHVVAIRGDAAAEKGREDFTCAADLTEELLDVAPFEISTAAYPEGHPKSPSLQVEMDHLKRKIEVGAVRVLTQFFFEPDLFLRFRDRCVKAGIDKPIIPGILPVRSAAQVRRFANMCGATIPRWMDRRFADLEAHPEAVRSIAVATVVELIDALSREGVEHFHLYTLNRLDETIAICRSLDILPGVGETNGEKQ